MGTNTESPAWPRRRLQLRSIISSTLPIGWTWVAATALIPYFWAGAGPGAGALVVAGLTRSTWLSLHVWSSIGMGLLTIGHVVLNRKGLTRSYRLLGGRRRSRVERVPGSGPSSRGLAWIGAAALALTVTVGGFAFAQLDEGSGGHGSATQSSGLDQVTGDQSAGGSGDGYRGGRNQG